MFDVGDIYVDIECLMDVRLSMVYDIDKSLISDLNSFKMRLNDKFDYIDTEVFNKLYKNRNKKYLEYLTRIVTLIKETSLNLRKVPENRRNRIFINTYPFNLTEDEKELFHYGFKNTFRDEVILIDKEVTPSYLSGIGVIIMYNGLEWLNTHVYTKGLLRTPLSETTMFTPIRINRFTDKDFYEKIKEESKPFINLNFLPLKEFSVI